MERFSQIYLDKGQPQKDSGRFRIRIASYFLSYLSRIGNEVYKTIPIIIGADVPFTGNTDYSVQSFIEKALLRDVLDTITIITTGLERDSDRDRWLKFVETVFREENLSYTVDQDGVVHFYIDEEFEKNRFSTLSCLTDPKYEAVKREFEEAYKCLDKNPPSSKESIKHIFEALETLFKLITDQSGTSRLSSRSVQEHLKPFVLNHYKDDETANSSAGIIVDSFCDWINAAHYYRHGQKTETTNQPPLNLAVVIISNGASFIRWLVELDSNTD